MTADTLPPATTQEVDPEIAIEPAADAVVLFDGLCGLCHGSIQWFIKRDRDRVLRYAPLQGETAQHILRRFGKDPAEMTGMWLLEYPGSPQERLLHKSDAALGTLHHLGGIWSLLSLVRFFPRGLRNWFYGIIARNRYAWFGKKEVICQLPTPEEQALLLP